MNDEAWGDTNCFPAGNTTVKGEFSRLDRPTLVLALYLRMELLPGEVTGWPFTKVWELAASDVTTASSQMWFTGAVQRSSHDARVTASTHGKPLIRLHSATKSSGSIGTMHSMNSGCVAHADMDVNVMLLACMAEDFGVTCNQGSGAWGEGGSHASNIAV